jgi:hypothetical protein
MMKPDDDGFETRGERRAHERRAHEERRAHAERKRQIQEQHRRYARPPGSIINPGKDDTGFDVKEETEELADQADEVAERARELADHIGESHADAGEEGFPTERES